MRLPIYLDNNATTRVDPRVLDAMLPYLGEVYGNAASRTHSFGWEADRAVQNARQHVASLLGAQPREIIFTSGATEANNIAILGAAMAVSRRGNHIITDSIEHKAVLDPCRHLEKRGTRVTRLKPDRHGRIAPEQVAEALSSETFLVSVMHANNEIGTINPIPEIGAVVRAHGALFHCDAAQSVGKLPCRVEELGVDLLSFSAHKIYGPKGIGALFARAAIGSERLAPVMFGGGQERGLRPGTSSVPLIAGLGAACEIYSEEGESERRRIAQFSRRLREGLLDDAAGVALNGHPTERLAGNVHLSIRGIEAGALMMALPDLALSSGSACTSAQPEPSHVLRGIGLSTERALGSIRLGIGRFNRADEIEYAIERIRRETARMREIAGTPARSAARKSRH